ATRPAGPEAPRAPAGPRGLCPAPPPPKEIAFRYDSHEAAFLVGHGQAADVPLQHDPDRLPNRGVRLDRYDGRRHHVPGFHGGPPFLFRVAEPAFSVVFFFTSNLLQRRNALPVLHRLLDATSCLGASSIFLCCLSLGPPPL